MHTDKGLIIMMAPKATRGSPEEIQGPPSEPEAGPSGLSLEIPVSELPEGAAQGDVVEMSGRLVSIEGDMAKIEVDEAEFMPSQKEELSEESARKMAEQYDNEEA
jgi:hypothetical protein